MRQAYPRNTLQPKQLYRHHPTMAGNNPTVLSDQNRLVNPNCRMLSVICRICFLEWVRALPGATDRVSVYHSQPRRENLRCPEFIVSREIPPTIQRSNFKPRCASSYTRLTVDQVGCQRW